MDKQRDFEKGWEEYKAKKKQEIEEMAKDLKEEKLYALINKTTYMRSAENLYDLGYRKIPENAVVLTNENEIKQYEWSKMLDKMGFFKFVDKIRKETAEKFAERLKLKLKELELGGWVEVATGSMYKIIDEICKEITEGKV